jgi:hypothetical protein
MYAVRQAFCGWKQYLLPLTGAQISVPAGSFFPGQRIGEKGLAVKVFICAGYFVVYP